MSNLRKLFIKKGGRCAAFCFVSCHAVRDKKTTVTKKDFLIEEQKVNLAFRQLHLL